MEKQKLKNLIIARIREMLDMPSESLEELRKEQVKIAKESERYFVKNKLIFDYIVSSQVAMLFWILIELGVFKDEKYKIGDYKKQLNKKED